MKDFVIVYKDELYHHGVKGMKWGVRHDKQIKNKLDDDTIIKKGHTFENVITRYDNDKNDYEYKKRRTYTSDLALEYLNIGDFTASHPFGNVKVRLITNNKDFKIAGKKTVNKVLKEIGEKPIPQYRDSFSTKGTNPDFLFDPKNKKEKDRNIKFIEKMKERSYDGMLDPLDAITSDNPTRDTARILFNMKDVTVKELSEDEYMKRFKF